MAIGKSPLVYNYDYDEKELIKRIVEDNAKQSEIERLQHMVDAMNMNMNASHTISSASIGSLETLKQIIDRKIAEHKKMIATLEWFSAHVKLDDPETDQLLVGRIIMSGLEALYQEKKLR